MNIVLLRSKLLNLKGGFMTCTIFIVAIIKRLVSRVIIFYLFFLSIIEQSLLNGKYFKEVMSRLNAADEVHPDFGY